VEPQPLVPDLSLIQALPARASPYYCALTEQETQCLAALNSVVGQLLDQESAAAVNSGDRAGGGAELACTVLQLSSIHQRNEDAATALELLFRLAGAEGSAPRIAASLEEIDRILADIRRLEEHGIPSLVSKLEVEQQRLDVQRRGVDLQASIVQLNQQLAALLRVDLPPNARFWPEISLTVTSDVPDEAEAVAVSYAHRADLAALGLAATADGNDGLASAELLLGQVSGGLGTSRSVHAHTLLHAVFHRGNEARVRSEQLQVAHAHRQRQIRQETEQAIFWLESRVAPKEPTRAKRALARPPIHTRENHHELTGGAPFAVRQARLEKLTVEQTLLDDVIAWKLATVQLKRAQGMLAVECGYLAGPAFCPSGRP
jgi:hypothetical protein